MGDAHHYARENDNMRESYERRCRELTTARQRIAELEAALAWRPIETAPADDTTVLVWTALGFELQQRGWQLWPVFRRFGSAWIKVGITREFNDFWNSPTHWRPLGPGPESDNG